MRAVHDLREVKIVPEGSSRVNEKGPEDLNLGPAPFYAKPCRQREAVSVPPSVRKRSIGGGYQSIGSTDWLRKAFILNRIVRIPLGEIQRRGRSWAGAPRCTLAATAREKI